MRPCRILEPKDFSARFRTAPEVNRSTKADREEFAEFERFVKEQGVTAISPATRLIDNMVAALERQEMEAEYGTRAGLSMNRSNKSLPASAKPPFLAPVQ